MLELGNTAIAEHRAIGSFCQRSLQDAHLITIGKLAKNIARQAIANGMKTEQTRHFDSVDALLKSGLDLCFLGEAIYLKASNSVGLSTILSHYKP